MSLLDDVSIVVTPNGYKAGELYAVIPVPTFGSDEITNGGFATDSDWSKGGNWSIGGGVATANGNSNGNIAQSVPLTVGIAYSVTYTVVNASAGSRIGISTNATSIQIERTTDGTYTEIFTASLTSFYIRALWNNGNPVSLDNVSVKEWVGADMDVTRTTDATRVDENGLVADVLANVPRIDYTGGGCPHILAEPQRTNLVTYSEDFSQSYWLKSGVTVSLETTIKSPNGGYNSYKISSSTSGNLNKNIGVTGQTKSIYVRTVSGTGTIGVLSYNGDSSSTQNITEEWQRFDALVNTGDIGGNTFYAVDFRNSTLTEVLIWGAQVEAGSYATSYIPTSGSTVTRNQDIFSRDGITSLINSTEGTLVIEPRYFIDDGSSRKISISDGTGSNRIYVTPWQGVASRIRYIFTSGGSTQADLFFGGIDLTVSNKFAFVWATNRFELWQNGVKISEDTSGTTPSAGTFNQINFGSETGNGSEPFEGELKQLQVYKTALTDTQLAALTS